MTQHKNDNLDLARIMSTLASRWLVIAACTFIVTAASVGYVKGIAKPVYSATALVTYSQPDSNNPTGGVLPSTNVTRENIGTLIGATGRLSVVTAAAKAAGITPTELRRSVTARPYGESSIIEFAAKAGTAKRAADRANAYADAFVLDRQRGAATAIDPLIKVQQAQVTKLGTIKAEDPAAGVKVQAQTELSDLMRSRTLWTNAIQVSNQAQPAIDSIWPKTKLTIFAALLVGFGLGCGVALLTDKVDRRLQDDEWDELPAPVLVRVPRTRSAPKNAPLGPDRADSMVADAFAALGARILVDRVGDGAHVVLVTSARSGEGKSTVAANLASALAQGGRRVILVDADMRKPTQDKVFPVLVGRPGLSQVLTGVTQVESALTLVQSNLAAVASGPRQSNASTLLASIGFKNLIDRLQNICEVVVIDAPPVLAVADALAMAPCAHQALICARVGQSDAEELEMTFDRLAGAARLTQAIVLVGTERPTGYGYDGEDLWPQAGTAANPALPASVYAAFDNDRHSGGETGTGAVA
ncbi:MAG: polysaccharide biosynthesis tyrosine autokinase [Thermoleophilia bacterium]|nr:polysaccharide biosynthesis tyrosine autokinase [Thermoleophilia bacterium]